MKPVSDAEEGVCSYKTLVRNYQIPRRHIQNVAILFKYVPYLKLLQNTFSLLCIKLFEIAFMS